MSDPFCPRQISFALPGSPSVQVTATENGSGGIDFVVDVNNSPTVTADLRALYFHYDETKLAGLQITGGDGLITRKMISANNVLDLDDGSTLAGVAKPFDIGIRWGTPGVKKDDINFPVHFTLSNAANNLTLDDFAHLQFGARIDSIGGPGGPRGGVSKTVVIAPAAPDAHDDAFSIFEDGASGLDDPSKTPSGVTFDVLANDTDADGDTLSITGFHDGPSHGTAAISLDGHSVIYTPDLDYAGTDSFEYCVSDGHGGQDHAIVNVTIEAVADLPVFTYSVSPGATVYDVVIDVTVDQDDADSSEFLDRIDVSSLPAGVTILPTGVNPGGEPDQIVQQFVLSLPHDTDSLFDLTFTATSEETSNGDQEQATLTIPIELDFKDNATVVENFTATDQSIWSEGDAIVIDKDNFFGIDDSWSGGFDAFIADAGGTVTLKTGFHSVLHINSGNIDASLPFDVDVNTAYNKTTDQLLISPSAMFGEGGTFSTDGPDGSYNLDFLFYLAAHAEGSIIGIDFDTDFGGPYGSLTDPALPIVDIDSDDASIDIPLPPVNTVATITVSFPDVNTTSDAYDPSVTDTIHSEGSDNIFHVDLDALALAFAIIGIPNPLDIGVGTILGLHFDASIDLRQTFDLQALGLDAIMTFEDGSSQAFDFNSDLVLNDASSLDANHDGEIHFSLALTPNVDLHNNTSIGGAIGADLTVLDFDGFDPLVSFGGDIDLGDITVYDNTFDLALVGPGTDYSFFA